MRGDFWLKYRKRVNPILDGGGTITARGVLKVVNFTRDRRTAWQSNNSIPLPCGMLIPQGDASHKAKGAYSSLRFRALEAHPL